MINLKNLNPKILVIDFPRDEWQQIGTSILGGTRFKKIGKFIAMLPWIEVRPFDNRKTTSFMYGILATHKFQDRNDPTRYISILDKYVSHFYWEAAQLHPHGDMFYDGLFNFEPHMLGNHVKCNPLYCKKAVVI